MKRICPACGMVQTDTRDVCPKCGKKTVAKGRHFVSKDSRRVKFNPEEGRSDG